MSTSKRKKEARQRQMKAESAVAKYKKMLDATPKKAKEFKEYVPDEPFRRETPEYDSLKTSLCDTSRPGEKRYTGDYITGITIVHKSGLAPVSRGIDPKDYATMRR